MEGLKFLLRGFINIYARMHPASDSKKLTFTIELVRFTKEASTSEPQVARTS